MDDIYSALIGAPPSDTEKLAALAKQLRGSNAMGLVAQLSGDKILSPIGANMQKTANAQAEDLGSRGEQARYRQYQEQASTRTDERARAEQAWREKSDAADLKYKYADLASRSADRQAARENAILLAGMKEDNKKYHKFNPKDVASLGTQVDDALNLSDHVANFKPEYAGKVAGQRPLENALARVGMGSQGAKDANDWWAGWERLYTLPTRNKLFGSALTATEKASWDKANINANMTPEQIQKNIGIITAIRDRGLEKMKTRYKGAGYDPDEVDAIFTPTMTQLPEENANSDLAGMSDEELRKIAGGK